MLKFQKPLNQHTIISESTIMQKRQCTQACTEELSPHTNAQTDKEPPCGSCSSESCGESDEPIMSFQALSLQHRQPVGESSREQRTRCVTDDDVDVSATTSATSAKNHELGPCFPLVRQVSLEPKTQAPSFGAPTTGPTANGSLVGLLAPRPCGEEQRPKRRRDISMATMPCLEEPLPSNPRRKRRRVERNNAMGGSDFDLILSQITL